MEESFFQRAVIDSFGERGIFNQGELQSALTSSDHCSFQPDVNPPTHLNNTHPSSFFFFFHILQFPRKQSHLSCWIDRETKLKGGLDCSHRTNNNSEFHPSRMASTEHDLFIAVCEHRGTRTHILHTHPCDTHAPENAVGKRNVGRASFSFLFITVLFLPHYSWFFPPFGLACLLLILSPILLSLFPGLPPNPAPDDSFSLSI